MKYRTRFSLAFNAMINKPKLIRKNFYCLDRSDFLQIIGRITNHLKL
jgi:hypothetical protein